VPDSYKTRMLGKWSFTVIYSCHSKFFLSQYIPVLILLDSAVRHCKGGKTLSTKSRDQGMLRKALQVLYCVCAHMLIKQTCKHVFACIF